MGSEKLKFGLIGCGRISGNHLSAAFSSGLSVEALCDIYPEAMENAVAAAIATPAHAATSTAAPTVAAPTTAATAAALAQARRYTDYREMLAHEHLDLVAITTKSDLHATAALDCIRAGVNVIIEKPMALSLKDADLIIEESRQRGVKVCACHQNRYNKPIQKARSALETGQLGQLMYASAAVRWSRSREYYQQAAWRGTWDQDGGALMNQCIHNIDLLRWMMGDEVTEVFAYTDRLTHNYIEAEDFGLAVVRFANGGYGAVEGTTCVYPDDLEETLGLFGTKGTVLIGGKSLNLIEHWQVAGSPLSAQSLADEYTEQPSDVYGFGHAALYADMVAAIREDRQPAVDAVAGRNAIELVLAIYLSAAEGRPVRLPLHDVSTTDFQGRF